MAFAFGFLNLVRSELIALGKHLGLVCIRRFELRVIVVQHLYNEEFIEEDSIEIRYDASSYVTAAFKFQDEIKIAIERYATQEACKRRMKRIVELTRQHQINVANLKKSNRTIINDNSNSIKGDISSEPDNHPSVDFIEQESPALITVSHSTNPSSYVFQEDFSNSVLKIDLEGTFIQRKI